MAPIPAVDITVGIVAQMWGALSDDEKAAFRARVGADRRNMARVAYRLTKLLLGGIRDAEREMGALAHHG